MTSIHQIPRALLLAALLLSAVPLGAQAALAQSPVVSSASSGPTITNARAGVQRSSSQTDRSAPAASVTNHHSQASALMIVGGIAVLAGIITGGSAGPLLILGGAGVGLYGLYLYLQ